MVGFLLPLILGGLLYAIWSTNKDSKRVLQLIIGAYTVRMLLQFFVRDLPIFSYGAGGDCGFYEWCGSRFARVWTLQGVEFFTSDKFPEIGNAALPINLFAFIVYLNGDLTRAGCTSVVAFCSVMACYQLYRLACTFGADETHAFKATAVLLFLPGYLFYTSDMYKDGIVLFFVITALSASFRLSQRFSVLHIAIAAGALSGLWFVRHYMVFLAIAPLAVGLLGIGKGSSARQAVGFGALLLVVIIAMRTSAFESLTENAQSTFDRASSVGSRQWNQISGSGVDFDDGGNAFGALHLKVLYTLFSPFPWQGGSFALQMGKIDTGVWYFFFWRAMRASRRLWSTERARLLMFYSFLIPLTIAYATTMANIGLILRQRLPIIYVGSLLGMLSWPALGTLSAPGRLRPGPPRP